MICERCKAAEAVIHLTRITDGVKIRHHYCVSCATAIGASTMTIPVPAERRGDGDGA